MARTGRRADDTKARIIEAALETLRADGIVGASARAIAKRGGFNQALIFYHFDSVHELLLAAVDSLSARRTERYRVRLAAVSTLRELVHVAAELHAEDLEDGHITVLSQMLAGSTTSPELRRPLLERFEPWIDLVEETVQRALEPTPYGRLVPTRDLAFAITSLFIGIELLINLDEDGGRDQNVFGTIEMLATVLESIVPTLPASQDQKGS